MLMNNIFRNVAPSLFVVMAFCFTQMSMAEGFDAQITAEDQTLYLNGEGPRKKAFLTIYDTALYLTEKGSDGSAIVAADHPMAVSIIIRSKLATASRISDAFKEGLDNAMGGNTSAIEAQTNAFLDVFTQGVVKGDTFEFLYLPAVGTRVIKNGTSEAEIAGLEFKQALFSIWLSENSISEKLRSQLLGQ